MVHLCGVGFRPCQACGRIGILPHNGRSSMTLLYRDPLFQKHDTGHHPENAGRLRAIEARLEKAGLSARCTPGSYTPLTEEAVLKVHAPQLVQRVKRLARGGYLDGDTPVSPESFQ